MVERPEWGALMGTATVAAEGESPTFDPPTLFGEGPFVVISGPCTLSEGGRCVGRWPGGYGPNKDCAIVVAGSNGVLGACPVFDMWDDDAVTLPSGERHFYSDCPRGATVAPGGIITWQSNQFHQGSAGLGGYDSGCQPKGICGLPYVDGGDGSGGGWQICFV